MGGLRTSSLRLLNCYLSNLFKHIQTGLNLKFISWKSINIRPNVSKVLGQGQIGVFHILYAIITSLPSQDLFLAPTKVMNSFHHLLFTRPSIFLDNNRWHIIESLVKSQKCLPQQAIILYHWLFPFSFFLFSFFLSLRIYSIFHSFSNPAQK